MHFHPANLAILLAAGTLISGQASFLPARSAPGMVFTETNETGANRILAFSRAADGSLAALGATASGGPGTGASLASQGAVQVSGNGRWLFAVNAGNDTISSFRIKERGLQLVDTAASGGATPVSLTVSGHLLYVLNQGGTGNVSGFRVDGNGGLHPIPGSSRPLSSSAAGAAEVAFSPDQGTLVVSEKATQTLDTYQVLDDGTVSGPAAHPSNGVVPYGFAFAGRDSLLVTEAGSNAVSSYDLDAGVPSLVSASVPSQGAAPCWITVTPDNRFAYASNAHDGTLAGFRVSRHGALTLLGTTATASVPVLDMAADADFVLTLAGGAHQILSFRVEEDGSLAPAGSVGGLPATALGLAAR